MITGPANGQASDLRKLLNEWDFNVDEYDCMIAPLLTILLLVRIPSTSSSS